MEKTYFEENGNEMLARAGFTKSQFARAMGIMPQNVGKMITTKNVLSLAKVAEVLNVPLQVLVYGPSNDEVNIKGCIYINNGPILISSKEDMMSALELIR